MINFSYQSPISQIYKDVEYKFKEDMENKIMEAVHHFGISVDKEELIKALQYDRNQYEKGYSDGRASIVEELENQKTGHWIPVSERLPKKYGEYLITWTTSSSKKPFISICECEETLVYDHEHNRFNVEWLFDDYIKGYPDIEVIAWMPLPEPYKAERRIKNDTTN